MRPQSAKNKMYKQAKTPEDYLAQRTRIDDETGCHLFTGVLDRDGYGQVHAAATAKQLKVTRAHQMAYKTFVGDYEKGLLVCHTCDNPTCINPDHLFVGTNNDNVQDMVKKGRARSGSKPKVNYEEVLAVKGEMNCFEASEKFAISFSRVCQIWRGEYGSQNSSV